MAKGNAESKIAKKAFSNTTSSTVGAADPLSPSNTNAHAHAHAHANNNATIAKTSAGVVAKAMNGGGTSSNGGGVIGRSSPAPPALSVEDLLLKSRATSTSPHPHPPPLTSAAAAAAAGGAEGTYPQNINVRTVLTGRGWDRNEIYRTHRTVLFIRRLDSRMFHHQSSCVVRTTHLFKVFKKKHTPPRCYTSLGFSVRAAFTS